ncbi:acetylcholinesterase precursor [Purpureocillium lavendulum]|uniref:Acetylcholinesterase n=1 Tax=Purpureocillium lavendulum TaxID=1247861 RepID=A0AB34G2R7_9HYPO|nr:acetylcholinesterase precursor [Purpureocillium lavendulum]
MWLLSTMITLITALMSPNNVTELPPLFTAAPSAVIPQGTIKGFRDAHCNSVYLGIPFAATTGGKNRWHPPQDVRPSTSQVEAVSYGATCPQAKVKKQYSRQGEDCLNLNIWAPPDARKSSALPVFVFMYGGAMVTGSNSNPQLQGTNFARKDVIYVNFNTRESIFAYPHSSEIDEAYPGQSQNLGILDVNKALEWVHSNIRAFGGNPDHIVFGGHSSGSVQVDHYLWNHPDTWLKGAVQMSANAMSGPAYAPMDEAMDAVAAEVGCPAAGNRQLECLRKVDIYTLETAMFNSTLNTWFTPVIDDITRHADYAFRFNQGKYPSHVSLLTGTADKEGNIFSLVYGKAGNFSSWINTFDADCAHIPDCVLRGAYKDLDSESRRIGTQYGDARFNCPVDYLIDMRSGTQSTWVYRFFGKYDNVVGPPNTAPTHGTEVPFFHGGHECFDSLEGVTSEQQALADFTHDWFVAWIKNPAAGPGWAKASPGSGPLVKLGMPGANTELTRVDGSTADYNALCKKVYAPAFPKYPVVQSGWAGTR